MARACTVAAITSLSALALALQLACKDQSPEQPWLEANAVPLSHVDPSTSLDDLEPLRSMVGDARIVALGGATYGTSEFFRVKHRILRFLVERMGFTALAIDANLPESVRLDRYVRTGQGNPEVLLSGLYLWTQNTTEVLEMIRWMRSYNAAGGNLGFYGFDMKFPGMAIDNVSRFIRVVDDAAAADFVQHLSCLATYANDASGQFPMGNYYGYGSQPQAYRDNCLKNLQWVEGTLIERKQAYSALTSDTDWAYAVRSARVAIQFAQYASSNYSNRVWGTAMAENVTWLADRLGSHAKIVLWAHNTHVWTVEGSMMGADLRRTFGSQLFVTGLDFARGSFTAVRRSGSTYGSMASAGPLSADEPLPESYEHYFSALGMPMFMLDLRASDLQAADSAWLAGPRPLRSVFYYYDPEDPTDCWYAQARLPDLFDAVVFFETSTPSTPLPFHYPPSF